MADPSQILLLLGGGLAAGSLGGLLGIGGGIILIPILRFAVGVNPAMAAGICMVAVFFTTLGGGLRHYSLGHIHFRSILPIVLSGAAASALFSLMFHWLAQRGEWIDLGMGIVFSLISLRMLSEGLGRGSKNGAPPLMDRQLTGSVASKVSIGAVGGLLPGLLGIGTGGILVPAFKFILKAPIKTAMAASLICFSFNALISSTFKISQGFVDFQIALPLCIGTLLGANLGVMLNNRFSSKVLKLFFGLLFSFISIKFIFSFIGGRI